MYFIQTQVNPVTGEKQHVAMSVDQEMALGLQAAPEMASKMGGDVDPSEDPRAALVEEVGRRLVRNSDARRAPTWRTSTSTSCATPKTINAFALPGGQVFITEGLLNRWTTRPSSPASWATRSATSSTGTRLQQMAKGQLGQLLTVAVGVGASDDRGGAGTAQLVAAMVNQMSQLRFSREDESQADHYGLKYMAEAGYDPTAMLDVMNILKEASGGTTRPSSSRPTPPGDPAGADPRRAQGGVSATASLPT